MTHTPGPWFVAGREINDRETRYSASGARIGSTPNSIAEVHPVPRGDADANARLIAAAPDLLAELERSATFLEAAADCCRACGKVEQAEVLLGQSARARDAIAKAKGVAK